MDFEKVKEIIVETLSCDADKVTPDARLAEDLEADSLAAVELSMALEEEFGVTIADEELPWSWARAARPLPFLPPPRFPPPRPLCRRRLLQRLRASASPPPWWAPSTPPPPPMLLPLCRWATM